MSDCSSANSCGSDDVSEFREKFESKLNELFGEKTEAGEKYGLFDDETYDQLLKEVEEAQRKTSHRTNTDYRRLQRFDILTVGELKKLIVPLSKTDGKVIYYVSSSECFDILHSTHVGCGHGGRNRMEVALKDQYKNISRKVILAYLDLCVTCQKKHVHPRKVVKPIISTEFNARGQVDLIDMQSHADEKYKFILVYQDHLTEFVQLRPLKNKTAVEVAHHLIDIFCTFGACQILQSDHGREFVNAVINSMKEMWNGLRIVHGAPRHSQSQGSVERADQDVGKMVFSWMEENNSRRWSEGLRFCQFRKNTALHTSINQSPYEAVFGSKAAAGLQTSTLPSRILHTLEAEEQLRHLGDPSEESLVQESQLEEPSPTEEHTMTETTEETASTHIKQARGKAPDHVHLEDITEETAANRIKRSRKKALEGTKKQAKKIKLHNNKIFSRLEVGTTAEIPVPDVDHGKTDARNIIGSSNEGYQR